MLHETQKLYHQSCSSGKQHPTPQLGFEVERKLMDLQFQVALFSLPLSLGSSHNTSRLLPVETDNQTGTLSMKRKCMPKEYMFCDYEWEWSGVICTFTTWLQHDKAFSSSIVCVSFKTDRAIAAAISEGLNAKEPVPAWHCLTLNHTVQSTQFRAITKPENEFLTHLNSTMVYLALWLKWLPPNETPISCLGHYHHWTYEGRNIWKRMESLLAFSIWGWQEPAAPFSGWSWLRIHILHHRPIESNWWNCCDRYISK